MLPRAFFFSLLTLMAGIPALVAWWRGRRIRRTPDDALMAERLEGERRRNAYVSAVTSMALIILGGWHSLWAIPLSLILLIGADFPLRRRIFGETWTFLQYLRFWLRWLAAFSGFWGLLALSPLLVTHSGTYASAVAIGTAVAMVTWNMLFDRAFLGLLGAKRVRDPVLLEAFQPVLERTTVPAPDVWSVDLPGSAVVTALALPNTRRGSVLFLSPLLERLPLREVVAVFAHEVGHLEQFTPRVLRMIAAVTLLTISIAVLLPLVGPRVAPAFTQTAVLCWPAVVVALIVVRSRLHRPLEFDSDRRAAVLSGDPDAVASALIRLHALARMPRRVDADIERWQSHPSLARRVQALRASSGVVPGPTHAAATFVTTNPSGTVTFAATGLRFGDASEQPYSHVHELRLDLKNAGRPSLICRDVHGGLKQIGIREEDAALVQHLLDEVDVHLAPEMASDAAVLRRGALGALVLSLVGLFWASSLSIFVAAALASFRASAPTLAAAAVAGVSGGAIAWWVSGEFVVLHAIVLVALGLMLLAIALRSRSRDLDPRQRLLLVVSIVVLGISVTAAWGLALIGTNLTALRLHRALAANPGVAVFPLSFAALLATHAGRSSSLKRRGRVAAAAAFQVLLGLVPIIAATPQFGRYAIHDPLIVSGPRFDVTGGTIAVTHRFEVGGSGDDIRLSPGGQWVSSAIYPEDDADTVRFTLVSRQGLRLELEAAELSFVDDEHVLVASSRESGIELAAHRLAAGLPVVWRQRLPKFGLARLDLSTSRRLWQVWGWSEDGAAVRFNGSVGEQEFEQRRWGGGDDTVAQGLWFVGSGDYAIRLEDFDSQVPSMWALLAQGVGSRLFARGYRRVGIVDAAGRVRPIESELTASCVSPPPREPRITCSAFDGVDSHVFQLGDAIVPVTVIRGALWLDEQHEDGTLSGTLLGRRVLIQPAARRFVTVRGDGDDEWFELAYSNGLVAISSVRDEGQVVVGRIIAR